jgi:uncharacterized Ntn-hydrolase superfamily protein
MMRTRRLLSLVLAILAACAAPAQATFSIVAHDPQTGELGIAVQSRAFSVGAGVPWAEAGVGAVATQSATNESFGPRGLSLMRSGFTAQQTLEILLGSDPGRENRQVGIVDAYGHAATFTGEECGSWAGDSTEVDLSVQGNLLAGPAVVRDMVTAFHGTEGELAEKLLAALHAAQAAGGDKRGQQSAALLVVRDSDLYPEYRTRYIDLRVEDHPSPIDELERVFRMHQASDLLEAHVRYAEWYDEQGNTEAAALERQRIGETLQATLSRGDASASTLNALAWTCATSDVYLEESLRAAERAVELEPENANILDTLAEVHFRMGNADEALEVIDRALALAPDDGYLLGQRKRFLGK